MLTSRLSPQPVAYINYKDTTFVTLATRRDKCTIRAIDICQSSSVTTLCTREGQQITLLQQVLI